MGNFFHSQAVGRTAADYILQGPSDDWVEAADRAQAAGYSEWLAGATYPYLPRH